MKKLLLYLWPIIFLFVGFWAFNHINAWVGFFVGACVIVYYGFIIEKIIKNE